MALASRFLMRHPMVNLTEIACGRAIHRLGALTPVRIANRVA
jgi:hypothetical protein